MQILEQLRLNCLFYLEIVTIPEGEEYRPVSQVFQKVVATAPKKLVRMTELCDGYYETDLDADDLKALSEEIMKLSHELTSSK